MKHRLLALSAGAALAIAVAPFASSAHASTCNERDFPEVCYAGYVVCNATYATYKFCSNIK